MIEEITTLGKRRYIGDRATRYVHDRWHPDCQGCGLQNILWRGDGVGFEPDTLDGALWEGYEYCDACHDKTEPAPPDWADVPDDEGRPERTRRSPLRAASVGQRISAD